MEIIVNHSGTNKRCDIIIATWNAQEMTRTALESIRRSAGFPYRLIIVDNSEEAEARAYFREIAASGEFGDTLLVQNERNLGWLKATNIGLRQATADYVCLLNNDVICGSDWLRQCIGVMETFPDIGLINPRGNERSENARIEDVDTYAKRLADDNRGLITELDHCSGFCMVIRRALLEQIGLLDEIFDGGHYEDDDLSRRAQQAGYRCVQCDTALVFHLGSQSFKKIPDERNRLIQQNRAIYRQRWGTVRRLLVCVRDSGVVPADLITLIRSTHVYLVATRNIPDEVLSFRHTHLTILRNSWLWTPLYLLLMSLYLRNKQRIDEVRVLFSERA